VRFMKRIISLLAVMAVMAALLAASAMPAFAASETGNCVGQIASQVNARGEPGVGGKFIVAPAARSGNIAGDASSNNCGV
jgi:hypothetical protein